MTFVLPTHNQVSWGTWLVVPNTEELISRPFLDENSIRQLFWGRGIAPAPTLFTTSTKHRGSRDHEEKMHLFTRIGYSGDFIGSSKFCHKLLLEQRDKNHIRVQKFFLLSRAGSLPSPVQGHQLEGGQPQPQEAGEREFKGGLVCSYRTRLLF